VDELLKLLKLLKLLHHIDGHLGLAVYRGAAQQVEWHEEAVRLMNRIRDAIIALEAADDG
jgi:hypothetical protein